MLLQATEELLLRPMASRVAWEAMADWLTALMVYSAMKAWGRTLESALPALQRAVVALEAELSRCLPSRESPA
jgi:hypothetical protein